MTYNSRTDTKDVGNDNQYHVVLVIIFIIIIIIIIINLLINYYYYYYGGSGMIFWPAHAWCAKYTKYHSIVNTLRSHHKERIGNSLYAWCSV